MQGQDDFEFKTIEDILNELFSSTAQNKCLTETLNSLTETLNTTLATTQRDLQRLSSENVEQKLEIERLSSENVDQTSELEKLTNENVQQQESIEEIDDILAKMKGLPLGSIIPWVNRPNINSHDTVNVPDGWQR